MTEAEWLTSTDPAAMLRHLTQEFVHAAGVGGHWVIRDVPLISHRKLRLFACACCRQVWHMLTDERSRRAVEVAERYADWEATEEELVSAHQAAGKVEVTIGMEFKSELAWKCAGSIGGLIANSGLARWFSVSTKHAATQAGLLRDIIGNPFRLVKQLWTTKWAKPGHTHLSGGLREYCPDDIVWEPWCTPLVRSLAEAAYRERLKVRCEACKGYQGKVISGIHQWRDCKDCHGTGTVDTGTLDPDRLAVLYDALMDAGCEDAAILKHLRPKLRRRCPNNCYEPVAAGRVIGGTFAPCKSCKDGYIDAKPPTHVRGCWVVDALTGRANDLEKKNVAWTCNYDGLC